MKPSRNSNQRRFQFFLVLPCFRSQPLTSVLGRSRISDVVSREGRTDRLQADLSLPLNALFGVVNAKSLMCLAYMTGEHGFSGHVSESECVRISL